MLFASNAMRDLSVLARTLAAHLMLPVEKVSRSAAGGPGKIGRIEQGDDCLTSECERIVSWFDENWPDDLHWPKGVWRPRRHISRRSPPLDTELRTVAPDSADFLARLSRLPEWRSGRRPTWWSNIELREFLTASHRQRTLRETLCEVERRHGSGVTSMSSIQRYWALLDKAMTGEVVA